MSEISQFQSSDLDGFSAKQTQEFLDKLLQQQVLMSILIFHYSYSMLNKNTFGIK